MAKDQSDQEEKDEGPDEQDIKEIEAEQDQTRPCPKCGAEVDEDAARCPRCGQAIEVSDASAKKVLWTVLIVTIVTSIIAAVLLLRPPKTDNAPAASQPAVRAAPTPAATTGPS